MDLFHFPWLFKGIILPPHINYSHTIILLRYFQKHFPLIIVMKKID